MSSAENIRYYSAGLLGGAVILIKAKQGKAASELLKEVLKYMEQPNVQSPPPMRELMAECISDPVGRLGDISSMEVLFTHPMNTMLEQGNVRIGSG